MGASEKRAAAFHPEPGPTGNPWTDEDFEVAARAAWFYIKSRDGGDWTMFGAMEAAFQALAPRVAAMVRAGQAEALRPVRALLGGGPDTPVRTAWRDGIECVEVPFDDLMTAIERGERGE